MLLILIGGIGTSTFCSPRILAACIHQPILGQQRLILHTLLNRADFSSAVRTMALIPPFWHSIHQLQFAAVIDRQHL